MQASGTVRPLRLSPSDTAVARGSAEDWPGVPIEVLPIGGWDGEVEAGPLGGAIGIMLYLRGSVELVARGHGRDRVWVARAGDAAIISGDRPARLLRCRGEAQVAAVDLSAGWLWAALGDYRPPWPSALSPRMRQRFARNVLDLLRCSQRPDPPDRLEVEDASFRLVEGLLDAAPEEGAVGSSGALSAALCRRLRDYVLAHLDRPVAHGDLAAVVGLPPRSFSTAFKATFRTTPYQYVLTLRLGEAARLMRATQRSLAEIAYDLGFSSQSHFSTAFRRAFHVSPRQYARGWRTTIDQRSQLEPIS